MSAEEPRVEGFIAALGGSAESAFGRLMTEIMKKGLFIGKGQSAYCPCLLRGCEMRSMHQEAQENGSA